MKMTKKKVFTVALAICLIAILSMGSLAWFNATDSVTNKFYMADSAATPDEIFSVAVWEYANGDNTTKAEGAEFENVAPGSRYHKEPYVENTGAYDQWIRVKVTVNNADAWIAALGNDYDLGKMFEGHDETAWTRYDDGTYDPANNTYTMVYYLNYKLEPKAKACLFNTVEIPKELDQTDMVFTGGKFELTILAEALQADNTGDSAKAAFEAYWEN